MLGFIGTAPGLYHMAPGTGGDSSNVDGLATFTGDIGIAGAMEYAYEFEVVTGIAGVFTLIEEEE